MRSLQRSISVRPCLRRRAREDYGLSLGYGAGAAGSLKAQLYRLAEVRHTARFDRELAAVNILHIKHCIMRNSKGFACKALHNTESMQSVLII